jgi:predicted site-specific integrase-resolvase
MTDLMTPQEACKKFFVTRGMIAYWIKKGRIQKHFKPGSDYFYYVSASEIEKAKNWKKIILEENPNLVTVAQAAKKLFVAESSIRYYANAGYIKKYKVFGNDKNYMVDIEEALFEFENVQERSANLLRQHARLRPSVKRDRNGKFIS